MNLPTNRFYGILFKFIFSSALFKTNIPDIHIGNEIGKEAKCPASNTSHKPISRDEIDNLEDLTNLVLHDSMLHNIYA